MCLIKTLCQSTAYLLSTFLCVCVCECERCAMDFSKWFCHQIITTAVKMFVPQSVSVEYSSYFHCSLNSIWKILEFIPGIVKHISLYVQTFVFANNVIFCLHGPLSLSLSLSLSSILRSLICTWRYYGVQFPKLDQTILNSWVKGCDGECKNIR